jgi:acetyl-CoA carboxylase biotin carboxyl carrier protein
MALRYDEISEILKIVDSSSCDEVVLETDEIKLIVRRHGANGAAAPAGSGAAPRAASISALAPAAPAAQPSSAAAQEAIAEGQFVVRAPMVGTFYRAPSPNAPPFVEIGSTVEKGDPLCIIEVMKLFTTIHAEHSGRITEIGAENGTLVEYDHMLFVIDPR